MLIAFICLSLGAIFGFVLCGVLTIGSHADDCEQAYRDGLREGRIQGTATTAVKLGRRVSEARVEGERGRS